jgi:peptidyl-prolyl cis-trans isomerase C
VLYSAPAERAKTLLDVIYDHTIHYFYEERSMLKLAYFAAISLMLGLTASANAEDKSADKSAAIVNGATIPQSRVDLRVKAAAAQGQPDTPELRKSIREDLINLEIISQEAAKNGLDKNPETAQQVVIAHQSVLAGAYVQDYAKAHPISDDALKQEYEALKKRVGNKEFKLSHILVPTEDEAKAVAAQLNKKGAKFSKIAKDKSKDPGSADKGGELGWQVPSNFVQPFSEAAMKLNKGQISEPVQTQFGWHIIKMDDVRDLKVPTFDEIKPSIQTRLQQQAIQKAINDLHSGAKIE